jgi:hypothetical protein
MTDNELEHLLRRYRPAGPHASLRSRVLHQSSSSRRRPVVWVAAAAVIMIAIAFHVLASRTYLEIAKRFETARAADEMAVVERITADLADAGIAGDMARQVAIEDMRRQASRDALARAQSEEIVWTR